MAFCCLAAIGEGFDLQAPGVTLPVLSPLFHLTTGEGQGLSGGFFSQKSLFLSMSTFGLLLGALLGGRASDRFGRKWVTLSAVVLFAGLSAATAAASSVEMLLWCRFITGVGLGGALPNLIAIVAEHVTPARRSTAVACLYASMPLGGAVVSLASSLIAADDWRLVYLLGGLLPLLATPGLLLLLHNKKPAPAASAHVRTASIAHVLFGEGRAAVTLALWLAFFCALIAMYSLLGWLPSLLVAKGLARPQAGLVQLGYNLFGALGSVIAGMLIDRKARITGVVLVFAAAILALAALAAGPATFAFALLLSSLAGCAVSGTQAIVYALAPGCYPPAIRGTGVGFGVAIGRLGSALGPLIAGALLAKGASSASVLGALAPITVLSGLAAIYVAARTRAGAGP